MSRFSLGTFIAGGIIGALAAAYLLDPEKFKKTADDLAGKARKAASDLKDKAEQVVDDIKDKTTE